MGPPGVGKTQIAVEYAARLRARAPDTWVFWVDARDAYGFTESYRNIARVAKIPGWEESKTDTLHNLVFEWLKKDQISPWLMILDNNDDADMLFTPQGSEDGKRGKSLVQYIPDCSHGSVLVTTRDDGAAGSLCDGSSIDIREMDVSEAKDLFRKKLTWETVNESDLELLLKQLEYLPLAISHAVAFISQNNSSVQRYLTLLKQESEFVKLLEREVRDQRRSPVPWSVMNTWKVSFDFLKEREPQAVELLSMLCFLDRQGIPGFLLQGESGDTEFTTKILGPLLRFRFLSQVKMQRTGDVFEMHSLVHRFTLRWVEQSDAPIYAAKALKAVSDKFPGADNPVEEVCQQLHSHARAVLETSYGNPDKATRAKLLHNAAAYEADLGSIKIAEKWITEALEIRKVEIGENHIDTLYSMNNLAMACYQSGKSRKAVSCQEEVVKRFTKVKGKRNTETLAAMNLLVKYYLDVSKWTKAEKLSTWVVEVSESLEDEDPVETLDRKMTLVLVQRSMGKYELAQSLAESVLEEKFNLQKQILSVREKDGEGERQEEFVDLFDVVDSERTLALIHRDQGQLDKAAEYMERVVETTKQSHGEQHPRTLRCQIEMALIFEEQGKLTEAECLGLQVTGKLAQTLSKEHPDTLASWSNLVLVYEKLGKLEDAEGDGEIVVETSEKVFGKDSRQTLHSKGNLASVYRNRGKLAKAAALGEEVLKLRESALGKTHPDVLMGITNLALTYQKQGRHSDVRELFQRAASPQRVGGSQTSLLVLSALLFLLVSLVRFGWHIV